LADPTEIGGNTAYHAGNDGAGSGIDADSVDGLEGSALKSVAYSASTVSNLQKIVNTGSVDGSGIIYGSIGGDSFYPPNTRLDLNVNGNSTTVTPSSVNGADTGLKMIFGPMTYQEGFRVRVPNGYGSSDRGPFTWYIPDS
jgi:hypothetical protein